MVKIRYDYLKKLQKYGMNLTPVEPDKKPELKNGKWFHAWTLKELAKKVFFIEVEKKQHEAILQTQTLHDPGNKIIKS